MKDKDITEDNAGYVFEGINEEIDEEKIKKESRNFLKENIELYC